MAPEQLLSRPIDARCDIYSAGVIVFLMATGRRPYEETTAVGLALAMNAGPAPSAHSINPLVPVDLSDAIAKALECDPARRYQSARELDAALAATEGTKTPVAVSPDATTRLFPAIGSKSRRWIWPVAAAALLTFGVVARPRLLSWLGLGSAPATIANKIAESGIAVLPLANLSGDPNQEYVADGMTEAIIAELGRVRSLRVISRQSVMRYKKTTTGVPQIADELGVTAVITGSVARSGDQLHVTVALVQPSPERQLWSETYDRSVAEMLTLSSEVAQAAARQVQATVTPEEQAQLARARPVNAASYQAYLLGRYFWNKRTKLDIDRAIVEFTRAIALDPNSALAYAGMADCYLIAWDNGYLSPQEAYREGKANASKAIRLDDTIAEAHSSLAAIYYFSALWGPSEQEFRRALALNPGYATAHQWLALTLSTLGRHAEAIAESRRALDLDPISAVRNAQLGQRLYFAGDYPAAVAQLKKAIQLDPALLFAHDLLGRTYVEQKQYAAAVAEFEEASRLEGKPNYDLAYGHAVAGNRSAATTILNQLLDEVKRGEAYPNFVAMVYVGLGQYDDAIEWYTKAYQQDEGVVRDLAIDPRLTPISRDPRFIALLQKSGLTFSPGRPRS
jgi:TolB-like protein/Flp pilus assembly protein TadD